MRKKKTIIHVNQAIIKRNLKEGRNDPCLIVRDYKSSKNCYEVEVKGTLKVIHNQENPLDCGARCWIETFDDVEILR